MRSPPRVARRSRWPVDRLQDFCSLGGAVTSASHRGRRRRVSAPVHVVAMARRAQTRPKQQSTTGCKHPGGLGAVTPSGSDEVVEAPPVEHNVETLVGEGKPRHVRADSRHTRMKSPRAREGNT